MSSLIQTSGTTMQGTLKQTVSFSGKGLHTGRTSTITLYPANANTGIIFRRIDKAGQHTEILAHWKNTKQLPLCTCLEASNGVQVRTIEHLMAAFYACGIDNVYVDVEGQEIPILDGSAQPFVKQILMAGVAKQEKLRTQYKVDKRYEVREGEAFIIIEPAESLHINVTIALQVIGRLNWSGNMTPEVFHAEICSARTFGRLKNGLLSQLTRFSKVPVCLGANTNSAVVIYRGNKVINKGGLRMPDEYVRHRLLDLMGDLMLSGGHILGKITAYSPAHRMTHRLLDKIFTDNND